MPNAELVKDVRVVNGQIGNDEDRRDELRNS